MHSSGSQKLESFLSPTPSSGHLLNCNKKLLQKAGKGTSIATRLSILFVFFVILFDSSAQKYVDVNAAGADNGTSWANAFVSLSDALSDAVPGDEIWVAQGTYVPTTNFNIPDDVKVYGGFSGAGFETQLFERDLLNNITILSGDVNGDDGIAGSYPSFNFENRGDNIAQVVVFDQTAGNLSVLDGFVISGGEAPTGGGMSIFASSPTIRNVRFEANSATNGGAVTIGSDNGVGPAFPTFLNCVFTLNRANNNGGAINVTSIETSVSTPTFINCTFSRNLALNNGGAIYNTDGATAGDSNPQILNSIIYENSATTGISMFNDGTGSTPSIQNSLFEDADIGGLNQGAGTTIDNGANEFGVDPLFVDPVGGDFSLQLSSTIIDTGDDVLLPLDDDDVDGNTNTSEPYPLDIDGNIRIQNGTVDLGAFESLPPQMILLSSTPPANANNIAVGSNVVLNFDLEISITSISQGTTLAQQTLDDGIKLTGSLSGRLEGTWSQTGSNQATFNPFVDFQHGEVITVTVTDVAQAAGGEAAAPVSYRFTAISSPGPVTFNETLISSDGDGANGLIAGDLDDDGDIDLVGTSQFDNTLAWFENDGTGDFTRIVIASGVTVPTSPHILDIDNDGDNDILIHGGTGSSPIVYYENDGTETFIPRTEATDISFPRDLFPHDIDLDGDLDFVISSETDNSISWYENNGAPSPDFTENIVTTSALGSWAVAAGDIDDDGDIDIIGGSGGDNTVSYYENDGLQNFVKVDIDNAIGDPRDIALADVNGDGLLDILVAARTDNRVYLFQNDGGGTFTNIVVETDVLAVTSVAAADVDGDGDIDVLSASGTDDIIAWYENDGLTTPGFTERIITSLADNARVVLAADFDGDQVLDIASASFDDDAVTLFQQGLENPVTFQASEVSDIGFRANWALLPSASDITIDIDDNFDFSSPFATNISVSGGGGDPAADTDFFVNQDLSSFTNVPLFYRIRWTDGTFTSSYSTTVGFRLDPGNALDFDGNDEVVVNSSSILLDGTFTLETWIKTIDTDFTAITLTDELNTEIYFGYDFATSSLYYYATNDGGATVDDVSVATASILDDQWHHIAVVKDNFTVTIYIDGVPQIPTVNSVALSAISLGGNLYLGSQGAGVFLTGQMDEMRIWNTVRTPEEIRDNLDITISGQETGLEAYYRFDEGEAGANNVSTQPGPDEIKDLSLNGNNGTMSGFAKNGPTSNWVVSDALMLDPFVTTWVTSNGQVTIPTFGGETYNYNIAWFNETSPGLGDGSANVTTDASFNIGGLTNGHTYRVEIVGAFPRIYFNGDPEASELQTIERWGGISWTSMSDAFNGCTNLSYVASSNTAADDPDLSLVTDAGRMFFNCANFNNDIESWNVSSIQLFTGMFEGASIYNSPLNGWGMSSAQDLGGMFANSGFNQPINGWSVESVTNMAFMFFGTPFNQNISSWVPGGVQNFESMFESATVFNQDLSNWNTGQATNMSRMFYDAQAFNSDLTNWDLTNVTTTESMFDGANAFNGDVESWANTTANIQNMAAMFRDANVFNRNIGTWDVSSVTNMSFMFTNAGDFNGDINLWGANTGLVDTMLGMFINATSFNQNLSGWDVSAVINMQEMFTGATNFNNGEAAGLSGSPLTWTTTSLQNTNAMFLSASSFNQNINTWNVSGVVDMFRMFEGATVFNQPLDSWDVSSVTSMGQMFMGATAFDQPLNGAGWNTSLVTNFGGMFSGAINFDRPLDNNWDLSNAISMVGMFEFATSFNQPLDQWGATKPASAAIVNLFNGATAFNQPLDSWDVSAVQDMFGVFNNATSFDQDLSSWDVTGVLSSGGSMQQMLDNTALSTANYNSTLIGWGGQAVQNGVTLGATGLTYSDAALTARNTLTITNSWSILGDDLIPSPIDNLIAFASSATEVTLQWSDALNETGYIIERADDFAFTTPVDISSAVVPPNPGADVTSVTFNAGADQPYFYRVTATNAGGNVPSEVEFATTAAFPGQALSFDGLSDHIVINADPSLDNLTQCAIEAWVKITDLGSAQRIVVKNNALNEPVLTLRYASTPTNFRVELGDGTVRATATGSIQADTWYHVVGSYNTTSLQIFVNGVQSGVNNSPNGPLATNDGPIIVGANADVTGDFFSGEIDELRIWSVGRDAVDILPTLYTSLTGNESDLAVYYPFDEGAGSIAVDRSVNTNDGTINGATFNPSMVPLGPPPAITNATWNDTNVDGNIDQVVLTFDQNVDINDGNPGDGFGSVQISYGPSVTIDNADYGAINTPTLTLNFTGDQIPGTEISGVSINYLQAGPGSIVTNSVATEMTDGETPAVNTDGAGPVISAASTVDNDLNGQIDGINITLSEPFDEAGTLAGDGSDFTVDGFAPDFATYLSGNDLVVTFPESGSVDTDLQPDVTLLAGAIDDLNGATTGSNQTFTPADGAPPAWIAGFPALHNFGSTSFDIDVQLSEPGTAYYVVVPNAATPPNVDDVRGGTGFGGTGQVTAGNVVVTTASTTFTLNVTGLTTGVDYDLYVVADEGGNNPQTNNTFFDVTAGVPFITRWVTTDGQINIPTTGGGYDYSVTWINTTNPGVNEGSETNRTGDYQITGLENSSVYEVIISGSFPRIFFNNTGDRDKIQSIEQWGDITWTSFQSAFSGCSNLTYNATDAPDLSGVASLGSMFRNATAFNATDLTGWDVSTITDMGLMFSGATAFNGNVSNWDVSNVTNLTETFRDLPSFNQNISGWTPVSATSMLGMFQGSTSFNQDISSWNMNGVTNTSFMFFNASSFDQNLGSWDITTITNMNNMLSNTAISIANYDAILNGWAIQAASAQIGVTLGATGLGYSNSGEIGRDILTTAPSAWTISGDQLVTPQAPTDLIVYATSSNGVRLEWTDNATNETGYTIERADDYGFSVGVQTIDNTVAADANSYDAFAGVDVAKFYRVTPTNGNENASSISSVEFATTEAFPGQAITVTGTQRIDIADDPVFQSNNLTIEAWINTTSTSLAGRVAVKTTGLSNYWTLGINPTGNSGKAFAIVDGTTSANAISITDVNDGNWHHLAATFNYTTQEVNLYVDGILEDTQNWTGTPTGINENIVIGNYQVGTQPLDGAIDELKFWDIIKTDFSDRFSPALGNEPNLVAYYPFDENIIGSTIVDRSPNTNDGTPVNNPTFSPSTVIEGGVVYNTEDDGPGSLREAINFANANPGTTITFEIPSAPYVINLASALPQITANNTIIDGVSLSGWTFGNPSAMVTINGSGIGGNANGIDIDAADVEVYGLIFTGFQGNVTNGNIYLASDAADYAVIGGLGMGNIFHASGGNAIYIVHGDSAVIQSNRIGTLDGSTISSMGEHGISTTGEINYLVIGGDFPSGEGNVISGAPSLRYGLNLFGSGGGSGLTNVTIRGNKIGTNENADGAIPNSQGGINFLGTVAGVTIGGSSPSDLNIISGNASHGLRIQAGDSYDINGNFIGLQSDGSSALANNGAGIYLDASGTNINIGDANPNIISENFTFGIFFAGNNSSNVALGDNVITCNNNAGIGYGASPLTEQPTIEGISSTSITVASSSPNGSAITVWLAQDGCNNDQGVSPIAFGTVSGPATDVPGVYVGGQHYTVYVEDLNGASQFSPAAVAPFENAFSFDGDGDFVSVPNSGAYDLTSGTIEAWINPATIAADGVSFRRILAKPSSTSNESSPIQLGITAAGEVRFIVADGSSAQTTSSDPGLVSAGVWQHVAVTWDGIGNPVRFYVNGQLAGEVNQLVDQVANVANLILGSFDGTTGSGNFSGQLDEIRIWNFARAQEDIVNDAYLSLGSVTDLVANYTANQGSGDAVDDALGNNGILNGDVSYDPSTAFLLDVFPPLFISGFPSIPAFGSDNFDVDVQLNESGAAYIVVVDDGEPAPTVGEIILGQSSGAGIPVASQTIAAGTPSTTFSANLSGLTANTPYDVYIVADDALLNAQLNPTLIEFTTLSAGPYPAAEGAGEALILNGSEDYVDLTDPDYTTFTELTVEAWIRPDNFPGGPGTQYSTIIGKGSYGGPGNTTYGLYLRASDGPPFSAIGGRIETDSGIEEVLFDASGLSTGEWMHVALSWSSGNPVTLYLNGEVVATSPNLSGNLLGVGDNSQIGSSFSGQEVLFQGAIDEVRIWNVSRSEGAIRQDLARKISASAPELEAYYRMDDSSDPGTLRDVFGIFDGTITSATYQTSGAHIGDNSTFEYTYPAGSGRNLGDFSVQNMEIANLPLHIYEINQTPSVNTATGFNNISDTQYYGVFAPGQTYTARFSVPGLTDDRRILIRDNFTDATWEDASDFVGVDLQDQQILAHGISQDAQFATAIDATPYPVEQGSGFALNLSAVSDVVTVPDDPSLQFGAGDFTIEAWFYFDGTDKRQSLVLKQRDVTPFDQIFIAVGDGTLNGDAGKLLYAGILADNRTGSGSPTAVDRFIADTEDLTVGWHHAALIQDYDMQASLYLDGVLVGTSANDHAGGGLDVAGRDLEIGHQSTKPSDPERIIDEVRIWDIALSEQGIREQMIAGYDPDTTILANLRAYYRFDENAGTVLEDIASSNDGVITGSTWVRSGAPKGDGSLFSYAAGPGTLSTAPFSEDVIVNFEDASNGIHAYLVGGTPDQVQAEGFNDLDQGKYYGVFAPGQRVDIRMDYNSGNNPDRRIVYRTDGSDNAAIGGWERLSGILNTDLVTDSVFAYGVPTGQVSTAVLNPPSSYPLLGSTDAGSALQFDGTNAYVLVPGLETAFDAAQGFTLEAWIEPTNLNGTLQHLLGINNSYRLLVDTNDQLLLGTSDGVTPSSVTSTGALLTNDTYVHVAATFAPSGDAELFINGISVHTQSGVSTPQTPISLFYIGGLDIGERFFGNIDEVRVWNTVVAAGDISAFFETNDVLSHPDVNHLVAYYRFDEGTGSTILEDVFSNNDGTLNGMDPGSAWVASGAFASSGPSAFITTWVTTDGQITIPVNTPTYTYNYDVAWFNETNPGVQEGSLTAQTNDAVVTGLENGSTYRVEITGDFPAIRFFNTGDRLKIVTVEQWGNIAWQDMSFAFQGCNNLTVNTTDNPDLSGVTNLASMFSGVATVGGDITGWDVSTITFFTNMFRDVVSFDQPIGSWTLTSALATGSMFRGTGGFNQSLNGWDVSGITNMSSMFQDAPDFNGDITLWNTASVLNTSNMFNNATSFDQDLGGWNMSGVTNASNMLSNSGLSVTNYDAALTGWALQTLQTSVTLGADGLVYSSAAQASRDVLTGTFTWNIVGDAPQPSPFITTWSTTDGQITIPTNTPTYTYNYDVVWTNLTNPGVAEGSLSSQTGDAILTGLENGSIYQIEISGDFPAIFIDNGPDKDKILTIEQWGTIAWQDMTAAFEGCTSLTYNAVDNPDLSLVTSMSFMFSGATSFNGAIGSWDVSNVSDFSVMFSGATSFDQDLGAWNMISATNLTSMFNTATSFNQDISGWNVSGVTSMNGTFNTATSFNQDISSWDVSSVATFNFTFANASAFNQPLTWNTASATSFFRMLDGASSFDQNLGSLVIDGVTTMDRMLDGTSLSVANYDATLAGWAAQSVQSGVTLGATGLTYSSAAQPDRDVLTNSPNFWVFDGDSELTSSFITTWITTDGQITIPTNTPTFSYSYDVSWVNLTNPGVGEGSLSLQTGDAVITGLENSSTYQVEITGNFPAIFFNGGGDATKIQTIEQWGAIIWESFGDAFNGCTNLTYNAPDVPDLTLVTDVSFMFAECSLFDGNLSLWNMTGITNAFAMFRNSSFNNGGDPGIDGWDVSNIVEYSEMFSNTPFNQPVGSWTINSVSPVTMTAMFTSATSFDQDISGWDVSQVTDMREMFTNTPFNQDISAWNVANVTDMSDLFRDATAFNVAIGGWNTSSVTTMQSMFSGATSFDQDLGGFDITAITDMTGMLDNSGLSITSYDATLIGWEAQTTPAGITLGANGLVYSIAAESARDNLIAGSSWTINGDTPEPGPDVTFTTIAVTGTTLDIGTTNNLVYKFSVSSVGGDATQQGFKFGLGGDATTADFSANAWNLYESVNTDVPDPLTATLVGTGNIGDVVTDSVGFALSTTILDGDIHYFYVTVDIDPAATIGHTFNVGLTTPDPTESFGIADPKNKLDGGFINGESFSIDGDATPPTVLGITPSVLTVSDSDTQLEVTIEFDEDMDTGVDASIIFPVEDPSVTLTINSGVWDDARNFRMVFDVTDVNQLLTGIDIRVETAQDLAGNVIAAFDLTDVFAIDMENPSVAMDVLITSVTSPVIGGTIDDNTASINVDVDGSSYPATNNADGTWVLTAGTIAPALTDGVYDVVITATDTNGNTGTDATTDELTIDTVVPVVTINTLTTADTSPELTGTIDDNAAVVDIEVDGQTYPATNNGDGTWTLAAATITPALTDGVFEVLATATDDAGNVGVDATTSELTIDTVVPVITVNGQGTSIASPELTGSVDDNTATIEVSVDGATYPATNNGDGTWTLAAGTIAPALTDGVYDVIATATDAANNIGTDASTDELTIDTVVPVITVDALNTPVPSPELTGSVDDNAATIEIIVNGTGPFAGTNNADGTWTLAAGTITPSLGDGIYEVEATAIDGVGNIGNDATNDELIINSSVPTPVITSTAPNPTNVNPVPVSVDFGEVVTGFVAGDLTIGNGNATNFINVDGQNYTFDVIPAADGTITVDIAAAVAQDIVAEDNLAAAQFTIDFDGTAPEIAIDFLGTSISSPELTGTIDDNLATIEVTLDGATYPATNNADGTWTLAAGTISALAEGTYDVELTATDALGNVGADDTQDELVISQTTVAISASRITSTQFQANWSEPANSSEVQNYQLDVSETSDFSTFVTGFENFETTTTNAIVSGVDFSTNYFYRVRVVNTASEVSTSSNTIGLKTRIDPETVADSLALVQIYDAVNLQGLNWETARLRNWDGINLDANRTRVQTVNISNTGASGAMPNPFTGEALTNGGLSSMTAMNLAGNEITDLMDFTNTSIASLDVQNNSLTFDDLELLLGQGLTEGEIEYTGQANIQFVPETNAAFLKERPREGTVRIVPHLDNYTIVLVTGGTVNSYSWFVDGTQITSGADYTVTETTATVLGINFDNMGEFTAQVTNSLFPDLTLSVDGEFVLATVDVEMQINDLNDLELLDNISGFLMEAFRRNQGYDTLDRAEDVSSSFTFEDVVLGDYLCGIDPSNTSFIPSYFGDVFEWELADTIFLRQAESITIRVTGTPRELTEEDGEGTLGVIIEEDFGNDGGRVDARRRAARRKCGLKRRRSSGRTDQEEEIFDLIAYGETDDNGEFQFGFLPEGVYRFFVEYPGIPLDESAFVQFEVGVAGVSETDFALTAFATEDGIQVSIEEVLGVILDYFKDLEVYPNPTTEWLRVRYRHLKSESVTAQLIDLYGNEKWSADLSNGFNGELDIDVSEYPEGIYILRFFDRDSRKENVMSYRVIIR